VQTLVGLPDLVALQALVERMKAVGEVLDVGLTQAGDLFLRVTTSFVSIGTQFRHLRVLGIRGK
jgi:HUS1 checkpoint protein